MSIDKFFDFSVAANQEFVNFFANCILTTLRHPHSETRHCGLTLLSRLPGNLSSKLLLGRVKDDVSCTVSASETAIEIVEIPSSIDSDAAESVQTLIGEEYLETCLFASCFILIDTFSFRMFTGS